MQSRLNPYISFKNNAKEAMEFYQSVFGGKLDMTTFKQANMSQNPADDDLVMHAMLTAENGMVIMGADTPSFMECKEGTARITISLSGDNREELESFWNKLATDGTVNQPLVESPWKDLFGMLTDKYGIEWMVNISQAS